MSHKPFDGGPFSRRDIIKMLGLGSLGAWTANHAMGASPSPIVIPGKAPAKALIQIWLWGGSCHVDTFDPKPEAGYDICGPLNKYTDTSVPGMRIGELLPELGKIADKYSLIRSIPHGNNGHETASYMVQTGRPSGGNLTYPSAAAVVALKKAFEVGYKGMIPPYIVLTRPQGRFSEAGFYGQKLKPFATGGNPADKRFTVEGIISKDITPERQEARKELLGSMDTMGNQLSSNPEVSTLRKSEEIAWDLITGTAGKVFDMNQEQADLRDKYGMNPFGQSCLAARRLIEIGVPSVTINFEGWDTHKGHFNIMRTKLPQLDKGVSALLNDLSSRGLLDSTVVWVCGEFSRTPRVQWDAPWNGGRNHFGKVLSALLAGGGFAGGQVIGSTDKTGEEVKDRPVYPWDMLGSIYERLGINPEGVLRHPEGYDVPILPTAADKVQSGGRLKELV